MEYHALYIMVYDILVKLLRKHLYLVYYERYKSESSTIYIERFGAKHPLLKPELIVVNDQIHGFKKQDRMVSALEKYPIFIELEYSQEGDEKLVEGIDLHAEANLKLKDRLSDVVKLAEVFERTIMVERSRSLTDPGEEVVLIASKISELYASSYLEEDIEEGTLSESDVEAMLEHYLTGFVTFIKALDDIVVKRKRFKSVDKIYDISDEQ